FGKSVETRGYPSGRTKIELNHRNPGGVQLSSVRGAGEKAHHNHFLSETRISHDHSRQHALSTAGEEIGRHVNDLSRLHACVDLPWGPGRNGGPPQIGISPKTNEKNL